MSLDFKTLLVVNAANLFLMAITLAAIMRNRLSPAAMDARNALLSQAAGWALFLLTSTLGPHWRTTLPSGIALAYEVVGIWLLPALAVACTSASIWLMYRALQGWLGPRPWGRTMVALSVMCPLGYAASFNDYAVRVGWSNGVLALQLLIACVATLRPALGKGGAWRWVIFVCTLTMAGFTATRGVLGAFYTESYPHFAASHPVNVLAILATNVSAVLMNLAVLVAWREEAEAKLRGQAYTDALTGLHNRHSWEMRAPAVFDEARRHANPLTVLALDLDFFKHINDTRGHEAGDQVLAMVGLTILENLRSSDVAARVGGEEFVILLPQTDAAAAIQFDQRLRSALQKACERQPALHVDFSAGLATLHMSDASLAGLMLRADRALYRAKALGRGRLSCDD
jgi:diguanylate cyclase (GGDEF)-like protein